MMETSILNQLPFDPGFLILGLIGLVLILLILLISAMTQLKSLSRKYDYFMRGKDAETLEDAMLLATVAMPSFSGFSFLLSSNMSNQKCINCCNAQFLGLFISTYTSRTSVKSIDFSIVFASNSQNILKSSIFLSALGLPIFLLT